MYLMMYTRFDIVLAMGKVSKYLSNPKSMHSETVEQILKYLKGTEDNNLLFDFLDNDKSLLDYVQSRYGQD